MDVKTREVPDRQIAVISKQVTQPELDNHIRSAFTEIFDALVAHGKRTQGTTPDEPTLVIFHGPVTPEQSSLVEVCVPFEGSIELPSGIEVKTEGEHHEAYTTVTKAGLEYPLIMEAYNAVESWVGEHGSMIEFLPSREVYIANVPEAGPDDEVCEIAFPFIPSND